jgi:hypothetical protein
MNNVFRNTLNNNLFLSWKEAFDESIEIKARLFDQQLGFEGNSPRFEDLDRLNKAMERINERATELRKAIAGDYVATYRLEKDYNPLD